MIKLAITKMSSKDRVVIPEEIRKRLGLKTGAQFIVVANKDTVIMKAISPPRLDEFDTLIEAARKQALTAGLKRSDIGTVIDNVRASR